MSGCFGNTDIDRYLENQLNEYLDDMDEEDIDEDGEKKEYDPYADFEPPEDSNRDDRNI